MKLLASLAGTHSRRIIREKRGVGGGEGKQSCAACGLIIWRHHEADTCSRCGAYLIGSHPGQSHNGQSPLLENENP